MHAGSIYITYIRKQDKHNCKEMACSVMVTEMAFADHQTESMITRESLYSGDSGDCLAQNLPIARHVQDC